jgi:hypothetical protein
MLYEICPESLYGTVDVMIRDRDTDMVVLEIQLACHQIELSITYGSADINPLHMSARLWEGGAQESQPLKWCRVRHFDLADPTCFQRAREVVELWSEQ